MLRGDRWNLITAILLVAAVFIQGLSIAGVFWSRAHFGHHFDPAVFSIYEEKKSDDSVNTVFRSRDAEEARRGSAIPLQDAISETMERAMLELDQSRARRKEVSIVEREAEKRADVFLRQAQHSMDRGLAETALDQIQSALHLAPDYVPAIGKLAQFYEGRKDYAQAKFQWERAAVVAQAGTPEMKEIQQNLDRLMTLRTDGKGNARPGPVFHVETPPAPAPNPDRIGPNRVLVASVTRSDVNAPDLYDLCFNLKLAMGSRGQEGWMYHSDTRIEVVFYDQSRTAAGTLIPIKVLSTILKPKQNWKTTTDQILSVKYSVPRGYFRKKASTLGNSYSFCGYVVNAYYRGHLEDSYAYPTDVLSRYVAKTGGG